MEYLNKVQLRGIVGNVRVQKFDGCACTRFSVATNYGYNAKDGCAIVDTTWHNILAWSDSAPQAELLQKGDAVYVEGRIRMQHYVGADGIDRTAIEILASKVARVASD